MLPEWHTFYEDYYDLLSVRPSITHRALALLHAVTSGLPVPPDDAVKLLKETIPVHEGWLNWDKELHVLFPAPVEIPSPRGDTLYPMVYLYDDVWRGSSHIMVAVCIIISNLVFKVTGYGGDRDGEVREMVDRICKSIETVSAGPCGPLRVGAGLRIAYEATGPETRGWIKGWLGGFETRVAAASSGTYPERTATEIMAENEVPPGL